MVTAQLPSERHSRLRDGSQETKLPGPDFQVPATTGVITKPSVVARRLRAALLARKLLLFVALLPLIDEFFTTSQHEVHHACELVGHCRVGAGFVHTSAQSPVERPQCRVTA